MELITQKVFLKPFYALIFVFLLASASGYAEESEDRFLSEVGVSAGFDSRYIGSGAENVLGEGGHYTLNFYATTRQGFTLDLWQSIGARTEVDETDVTLTYEWANDIVSIGGGYRYLYFKDDEADDSSNDNEILFGVQALSLPFEPGLSYLHSTNAGGGMAYLSAGHSFDFAAGEIGLSAEFGYDFGYLSKECDCANHLLFAVEWSRGITDSTAFSAYVSQVITLENLDDLDESNATTFGVLVSATF